MMRPAFIPSSWDLSGDALRRRGVSVALAIAIHVLLLLLLLRLTPPVFVPVASAPKGATLDLLPDQEAEADRSEKESEEKQQERKQAPTEPAPNLPKPVVKVPSTQSAPQSDIWSKVIPLTNRELAAVDDAISRPSEPGPQTAERGGSSSPVVGTGPHGQPLYAAQWYRPPTDAQLAPYLPASRPRNGWGMIYCQTVADYRVDNCQELDQSPAGSGFAGAVRQAAWQFRVIPPRVGGRTMVGTWVTIRIDYTETGIR